MKRTATAAGVAADGLQAEGAEAQKAEEAETQVCGLRSYTGTNV